MNASQVDAALATRYRGDGWAKFFQFRPMTSYEASLSAIDLLVVGLWRRQDKIVAHEVKVDRGDFLRDLKVFKTKHQIALRISHEFYYVCPWGMIQRDEIPEVTGLMYVDKGFKIRIKKPAPLRELDEIPFHFFQGFVREFGNKVDYTKMPVKYLGKDMTQDDLMEIVEEKKGFEFEREVDKQVKKITEEREAKKEGREKFIRELMNVCGFYLLDEKDFPEIVRLCSVGKALASDYEFLYHFNHMKKAMQELENVITRKGGKKGE